ncbi:MAG TPA: DUF4013 domain-containing protein [Anaerolineales bacterium]|nr:DUF4013 domain-containing protein [Anaerolineales bacterium]HRF47528.1 DUF4013 domain-containing protein [Anaerolineales bacterium]
MTSQIDLTSVRRLLRFPFAGSGATNQFVLGAAILVVGAFVPILPGLFVAGYLLRVMRDAIEDEPLGMPAWTDWGELLVDGLKATLAAWIYLLPGLVAFMAGMIAYFVAVPLSIGFGSRPGSGGDGAFVLLLFAGMGLMFLGMSIGSFLSLVASVPLPVALARLAAERRFGAAFQFGAIHRTIRADAWGYLAAWVLLFGVGGLAYVAYVAIYFTWILCFIAPFLLLPMYFYALLVAAAAFGCFYRESLSATALAATPVTEEAAPGQAVAEV